MKDAFAKAGLEISKLPVVIKEKRRPAKGVSASKPAQKSESELKHEAYAGAQQLRGSNRADLGASRPNSKRRGKKPKTQQVESDFFTATDGSLHVIKRADFPLSPGVKVVKPPKAKVAKPAPTTQLKVNADTQWNLVKLRDDDEHGYWPGILKSCPDSFPAEDKGEIDLVIGLDFGTSYCKAVIQEPDSGRSWAVPFTSSRDNPYILLTRVVLGEAGYRLSGDGEVIRNLKVPLLEGRMAARHPDNVVAFLALVIRHIKQWAMENIWDELAGMLPYWSINMGLAASNSEDTKIMGTFAKLLHASALLSNVPGDSLPKTDAGLGLSKAHQANAKSEDIIADTDYGEVHLAQYKIFPEIAAQISGYIKSDLWDRERPLFMMVDVGGGTVDGAIVRVTDRDGELNINFLKTGVEPLGVFVLHMKRLKWHREKLRKSDEEHRLMTSLNDVAEEKAMPGEIPGVVENYLNNALYPEETVDTAFKRKFAALLRDRIINPVRSGIDPNAREFSQLPYLLCGGGRSIKLYNQFYENMNRTGSNSTVHLDKIVMRKPDSLRGDGIGEEEYHRLSVAYGLSFREPGEVCSSRNLPAAPKRREPSADVSHRYVGAELT